MIDNIIDFSIRNKLIIALFTLVLIGAGIWSMTRIPIDAVPDITNNQVQVITQAPNLGTEDIEQFVTYPVELAMANLPGVVEIRSVSRFGLSVVTIVFEDDMGTYLPRQLVSEKLGRVRDDIPEGFGESFIGPITTGLGEIYQYTLNVDPEYQDEYSAMELRTIQDWIVRRQMAMVPGVVEVNSFGGQIKQYEVAIDPDELRAIDLTITDVFHALEQNNRNTGGGYIEKDHHANFIRGEGLVRNIADIEKIVVKTVDGIPILVRDIAEVQFGHAIRYGAFTKNGNGEAVGGIIMMLKGANSNRVIGEVKDRIAQIQESLPPGVSIEPFLDRSELISRTTRTISGNLAEGALIVIFVLVFLLGNWRGGLIVASTIPLSLLFAFIMMNLFDVWANLMSLGAIDFGIIVDGAVIIVEGTVFFLYRKMREGQAITAETRDQVTYTASSRMMKSAFFGQLIILIVFLPILALEGVEGKMFRPMAFTFMFAMLGAMILCLTYIPMMSSFFIRISRKEKRSWGDRIVNWLEKKYEKGLGNALRRKKLTVGSAVLLLLLAIFTFSRMGGEFIPQLDEGNIAFHVILKPGSSLSEAIESSTKVERIVLDNFPEVEHAMTRFGVSDVPTDPMPIDLGDCFLILKPKSEWVSAETKEELIEKIKEKISILPGLNYEFTQPIEMRFNELISGIREDVAIKLYGEDLEILAQKGEEIGDLVAPIEGVGDMRVEATTGMPQMTVVYQRDELAQYGLNVNDINKVIESAFAGGKAGIFFEGEKRFDLVVRLDSVHRTHIDDLKTLYINTPDGAQIPLKEVAEINYTPGPMQISRDNTNRRIYVGINVRGRDIESLVAEIRSTLNDRLNLPAGYYIRYGGAFENLERATQRLKIVVPVSLFLIFILIFFALRSLKQSIMIYMAIPLAAIGGVFSLWIRDMPFSISAGIGFIVLFGVAVLNGLVLINSWNELKQEGVGDIGERITTGAVRRIRPILLTALTDILGFLPMAIAVSAGAEVQRPLATVVIGGMITSTLLTLFILPVLYGWTETVKVRTAAGKILPVTGLIAVLGFSTVNPVSAQDPGIPSIPLTLEEAVARGKSVNPALEADKLEIEKQEALKKTAWDLGNTRVFTGREEAGNGFEGVHTQFGISQQQIDPFAIAAGSRLQEQKKMLAESSLDVSTVLIEREIKRSWAEVYYTKRRFEVLEKLDSLFKGIKKAAGVQLETESISKLEFLATANQANRISIQMKQAYRDYQVALTQYNRWFTENDTLYNVSDVPFEQLMDTAPLEMDSLHSHPLLGYYRQRVNLADAMMRKSRSGFYPKFSGQFGKQTVQGRSGFYSYQLGISIPLFFGPELGHVQSSEIERKIARRELAQKELEINADYQAMQENYLKWFDSWNYYHDEAMPLIKKQKEGAVVGYREGSIDYITFLKNMNDAIQMEIEAWEAFGQYLDRRFRLEYFVNVSLESNN